MDLRSGIPYWLIKNGLPFNFPKLEKDLRTDILILGGGISGALCGYYFTKAGIDCAIIDARSIGLGSSCASTGLLQYEIDTPLYKLIKIRGEREAVKSYKLCEESIYKLQDIANEIKLSDFQHKKSFFFASYKKHKTLIDNEYIVRKKHGFNVEKLDKQRIQKEFTFTSEGGILSQSGAQTDTYMLVHLLHQWSKKKGVPIFDRTNVVKFDHRSRGVILTTENGCTVTAKKIVYATGYESVNYIAEKLFTLTSTYVIASEQYSTDNFWSFDNCLLWETASPYLYLRSTTDHRIVIGGKDESFFNPKKRDALLKEKGKALERSFKSKFPMIDFKTEFSWTGTFSSTPDGLPFIGPYKKLANSYFALGFGGNGITFNVIAAEIIRDLILKRSNQDAHLFRFDR
ncbi:Gamma-glutamylputrescine oxidoreductase [compost metagenome]